MKRLVYLLIAMLSVQVVMAIISEFDKDLMELWKFDEDSGNLVNILNRSEGFTPFNQSGIAYRVPGIAPGSSAALRIQDNWLHANGSGIYLKPYGDNAPFTMGCFIYIDNMTSNDAFMVSAYNNTAPASRAGGYYMEVNKINPANNLIYTRNGSMGVFDSLFGWTNIPLKTTMLLGFAFNGSTIFPIVNNTFANADTSIGLLRDTSTPTTIQKELNETGGGANPPKISVVWDDCFLMNRSLTTTEVGDIWTYGISNSSIISSNCSDGTLNVLNITFYNESDLLARNSSIEGSILYSATPKSYIYNVSFSAFNVRNISLCVSSNQTLYAYVTMKYYGDDSRTRTYYMPNVTLVSGSPKPVELALIDTSISQLITMEVKDESDRPMEGVYIKTERKYESIGAFKLVEVSKTDFAGTTGQWLVPYDVMYKYSIEKDGSILPPTPTSPVPVYKTTLYFQLFTKAPFMDVYKSYGNMIYTFGLNNDTKTFSFSYSDKTGVAETGCLRVMHSTLLNTYVDYDNCVATGAGSISYTYPNDNATYFATAYVKTDGGKVTTVLDQKQSPSSPIYKKFGRTGLLMSFIWVGTLASIGAMMSPTMAIMLTLIGLFTGVIMNLTMISYSILIGLLVIGGAIMWRLKR